MTAPRPSTRFTAGAEALLTPAEVAALFRVDSHTVARWARAGRIPSVRTPGGHHRFPAAALDALLASGERPAPQEWMVRTIADTPDAPGVTTERGRFGTRQAAEAHAAWWERLYATRQTYSGCVEIVPVPAGSAQ